MTTNVHEVELGELVVVVFDVAAKCSADPREISHLATTAVKNLLRRAGARGLGCQRPRPWPRLPPPSEGGSQSVYEVSSETS
jgi:hypothetical protein